MKPIFQILKRYPPEIGGIEVVGEKISHILHKEHKISVLTYHKTNELLNEQHKGIDVERLPTNLEKGAVRFSRNLKKSYTAILGNPENVVIHHYASGQPDLFLAFKARIKATLIVFYHMDVVGRGWVSRIYNRLITRPLLRKADEIWVTSPNIVKSSSLLTRFSEKIEVVPLFVDTDRFKILPEKQKDGGNKNFEILYVGRFGRYKGLSYLLEAIQLLPDRFKLTLVGSGIQEEQIKQTILQENLSDRVCIKNHVSDEELPGIFNQADLFVLPSTDRGEAFGLVVIEAMSCGKPVITTELGTGTTFPNIEGQTGKIVPPRDSKALASAIEEISKGDYDSQIIRNRALEFSEEKFKERIRNLIKKH